jgi:hypothetical protein
VGLIGFGRAALCSRVTDIGTCIERLARSGRFREMYFLPSRNGRPEKLRVDSLVEKGYIHSHE